MKKYELIRAVVELQDLKILSPAQSYNCIQQIVKKTITGTNKNFDKEKNIFNDDQLNKEDQE